MAEKEKLYFTNEHEWIEVISEDYVRIGISDYAVEQLGDVVFVELPALNDTMKKEEGFATVESVKSSSDIYGPVEGTITKINDSLEDEPEKLNDSPFSAGWIVEVQVSGMLDTKEWMDAKAYDEFVSE
ncbi:glycine cleavage system H protein [Marinilactibacillus piezotolerans]|uniref:Glycine cleavage system H protein n=1 Tax=Marinilactibacillus piezotolerans TaxID=258723 RepID=A0A1I3WQF6_9LACT|nr:glycine cleavage system protein GcvH [Marinilactibacillus piezotolerans]SFK09610.1 glycine cleavage system H protein [Marinilactibacillus piezotolerans]